MFDEARQSALYDDDQSFIHYLGLGQARREYWQDYEDEGCSENLEADETRKSGAFTQGCKLTFE